MSGGSKQSVESISAEQHATTVSPVPMLDMKLQYEFMKREIDSAIARALKHQTWILGPEVREFESQMQEFLGAKHCLGTSSGTEALVVALRALAIHTTGEEYFTREHEVLTTAFTFTATGDAILRAGATPVFIDIDPVTFNLDISQLRAYLAKQSNVVGIIPVHLFGQTCEMDSIMELARANSIFVLEDVAQAFGATWKGRQAGTIGTFGAYSFFPSKNLGGFGDGGLISTDDAELAELARMLTKHGGKDKYNVDHIGYNARLDTLQAAILVARFTRLPMFNLNRKRIASQYKKGLAGVDGIILPETIPNAEHVYHQFTLRVLDGRRDALQKHLESLGVSSMVYYPVPLHKMRVFNGRAKVPAPLPHSERAVTEVLSLPMEPLSTPETVERVIGAVKSFFKNS